MADHPHLEAEWLHAIAHILIATKRCLGLFAQLTQLNVACELVGRLPLGFDQRISEQTSHFLKSDIGRKRRRQLSVPVAGWLGTAPPYPTGPDILVVAYYAAAEISCHLARGWPVPERVLDLFTEFRNRTNGVPTGNGAGLLGALAYHGLDGIGAVEKDEMRAVVLRGGPWSDLERAAILDYCESDVAALARLLPAMLPKIDLPLSASSRAARSRRLMFAIGQLDQVGRIVAAA